MSHNEENRELQGNHKHSPIKHMLHMIICCGFPIVLILSLPVISAISPNAGNILAKIIPILCPIMMILMMPMMMDSNKKGDCCDTKKREDNIKELT